MKKKLTGIFLFCALLLSLAGTAFAAEKEVFPYYVTVNLTDNIVTVYEQDEDGEYTVPKKAFLCSGGEDTPEGKFQTIEKYDWRFLFGDVWGQYSTRITGHYLFHSVPYLEKDKGTLEYEEYNKLGTTASMGCIRLTVKDAKWIYDHCPIGTTIEMYRGDVEEPLQPEPVKKLNVKDEERRGWDPTDPDADNPWRKGEMQKLAVTPSLFPCTVEGYYENWTYYVSAADAKKLFSHLDVKLSLPTEEAQEGQQELTLEYNGKEYILQYRMQNGKPYYKLRDLANMVGAEMTWQRETGEIGMQHGEEEITISQMTDTKEETTFSAKLAAFFLD